MNMIKWLVLAAACVLAGCQAPAGNAPANANANSANVNSNANANRAATTTTAAPSAETLMAKDKAAYEAWKTKNTGFWDGFLAQNFVGIGMNGKMDRAAAMKEYAGTNCDVKSYSMSDEKTTPLGPDAVILSYKLSVDATCGGKPLPPQQWTASLYVREGNDWKGGFHAEVPLADPNAPAPKASAAAPAASPAASSSPAASGDTMTDQLMAVEKKAWEAWKNHDMSSFDAITAQNFMSITSSGRRDRADSLQNWVGEKCEGVTYSFSDPKATSFGNDVALVTYNANMGGTCDGKPNTPHTWVASFDVKEGDTWKNAFYMESPR